MTHDYPLRTGTGLRIGDAGHDAAHDAWLREAFEHEHRLAHAEMRRQNPQAYGEKPPDTYRVWDVGSDGVERCVEVRQRVASTARRPGTAGPVGSPSYDELRAVEAAEDAATAGRAPRDR